VTIKGWAEQVAKSLPPKLKLSPDSLVMTRRTKMKKVLVLVYKKQREKKLFGIHQRYPCSLKTLRWNSPFFRRNWP
jgi:hypothetical protein